MSQEKKKAIAPKIQKLAKAYGVKCSLAVQHHSTIIMNIRSGKLDFIENYNENIREANKFKLYEQGRMTQESDGYIQVMSLSLDDRFSGKCLSFLEQANEILYGAGYYNNTDSQIDYFDVAYYVRINIGSWNKPYQLIDSKKQAA